MHTYIYIYICSDVQGCVKYKTDVGSLGGDDGGAFVCSLQVSHEQWVESLAMEKRSEAEVPRQALRADAAGLRSGTERSQSRGEVRRRPLGEETH